MINLSQRPLPDNTQHSQQTNIHAPGGIRTHNLSRRAAEDLCLRLRGHWDWHCKGVIPKIMFHPSVNKVSNLLWLPRLCEVGKRILRLSIFYSTETTIKRNLIHIAQITYLHNRSRRSIIFKFCTLGEGVYIYRGKQWQTTPKNLPRMQHTRAIPVD